MPAPEDRSPTAKATADLSRLRIDRGSDDRARLRGFPWIRVFLGVGVLALLFLFREPLLGLFADARGTTVKTARAIKVVPGQAQQGDVSANGYIVADKQASLASVISGRLVELNAAEGDTVEADAVVARIQYDDLEVQEKQAVARREAAVARLEEAKSGTASARARVVEAKKDIEAAKLTRGRLKAEMESQIELAESAQEIYERLEREVERNRRLYRQKVIGDAEWDQVQTVARTAKIEVDSVQARVRATEAALKAWGGQIDKRTATLAVAEAGVTVAEKAETTATAAVAEATESERFAEIQLEKTRIRAPFRGLVIRKDAEKGEVISPLGAGNSRGSVLTIVDPSSLEVQVELSERRINRVSEGDRAVVFLDADPEQGMPGYVRKIWPRADRSKGSIEVRVRLDKNPADLRPEMAARVVFKGEETQEQEAGDPFVTVPRAATAKRGGNDVVFVYANGVARQRTVTLGRPHAGGVVVEEGLEGGEKVILDPASDLEDGSRVNEES